jgi:putative acetyltransferase
MGVRVERVTAPIEALRELIAGLDDALNANYLPEQRHGLKLDALFAPHIRFFIAWRGDVAVGCGGIALFADYAEVKRMFVVPAARGTGVAKAVLARLEEAARAAGIRVLRLETGDKQVEAMGLYERSGFVPCPAFGDYVGMTPQAIATSVFLAKDI